MQQFFKKIKYIIVTIFILFFCSGAQTSIVIAQFKYLAILHE